MMACNGCSETTGEDSLTPRDDFMEFDVRSNTKELERNLNLQGCPRDLQDKVKEVMEEAVSTFHSVLEAEQ